MIVILDLGWGNIGALESYFYRLGPTVRIASAYEALDLCVSDECVVVWPGVGSASQFSLFDCSTRRELKRIFSLAKKNIAICLGFQILFELLEESQQKGLGLMTGEVKKLSLPAVTYRQIEVPSAGGASTKSGRFYFNHSYFISSSNETSEYLDQFVDLDGQKMLVLRRSETFLGCQFHPEKSGSDGVEILREFLS